MSRVYPRVAAITEKLIGTEVTSVQVSRAAAELDWQLQAWRNCHFTKWV
jgi:hypothetical protein